MLDNPTVNLSALCNSCAKIAYCWSEFIFTFLHADSSIWSAGEQFISCTYLSFVNLTLHPSPQTKMSRNWVWRFKQLYFGNHYQLDTCSYGLLSHNDQYYHLPKFWLFSWITLYMLALPAFAWESWYFARRFCLFASLLYEDKGYCKGYIHWCNSQILPEHSLLSEKSCTVVRYVPKCNFIYLHEKGTTFPASTLCARLLYPISPNWTMNANTWAKILCFADRTS